MTVAVPTQKAKLVLTSPLESGEELREAVRKACKLNGFTNTSIALDLAGCRSAQRLSALAVSDSAADLCAVSKLLGIPDDNELLATVLTPSQGRSRDYVSFFGHHVRRGHIARTRRIAPRSMKHKPEMKAIWSLKPLSFDPATREMLLDRCPNCQNYLGWEKSWDPWICEHCVSAAGGCGQAFDLRSVSMPIFQPSDPKALDYVAFMLDPLAGDRSICLPVTSAFRSAPAGDMFQLAARIALTCQRTQDESPGAYIEPAFIEAAGRAILDWPSGFLQLVESTPARIESREKLGWLGAKPLRQLIYEPTLSAEIRYEIKKVLEVARRAEAITRASRSVIQAPSSDTILKKSGQLDLAPCSGFEAVMTVLRDTKEVRNFSRTTGMTVPDAWRLYSGGLAPELVPILGGPGSWQQARISNSLQSSIFEVMAPGTRAGGLDLVSARFALDPKLNSSWVSILGAVIDRRLEVWFGNRTGSLTANLYVNDFEKLRSIIEQDSTDTDVASTILTQEELSILMRKSTAYAASFARSGILDGKLSINQLGRLREKWAFGFELDSLAVIAGITQTNASRRLHCTNVDRIICGPTTLWSREQAVETLNLAL